MARPRVQVLLDDIEMPESVRGALERLEARVELARFAADPSEQTRPPSDSASLDARVLVTADAARITNGHLDRLLKWCDGDACATLVVSASALRADPGLQVARAGRPIGFAVNPTKDDLAGRLAGMCELRRTLQAMQTELDELRRRERVHLTKLSRLNDQLRQAGALQRDLLPSRLPEIRGAEVHALYRPAEHLSGDLYDAFRLDDAHAGLLLADATGHGLPAGMLSTMVRGSLRGRRPTDQGYEPLQPGEVLSWANGELLDNGLSECHFVAALYAVYDEPARRLVWARGGAPYPILIRPGEKPRGIPSEGPILGACPAPRFETVQVTLRPGDTVVFHTDGLDALLLDRRSGLGCCDLERTEWFRSLGREPIARALEYIDSRLCAAGEADWNVDDVSVLALHLCE